MKIMIRQQANTWAQSQCNIMNKCMPYMVMIFFPDITEADDIQGNESNAVNGEEDDVAEEAQGNDEDAANGDKMTKLRMCTILTKMLPLVTKTMKLRMCTMMTKMLPMVTKTMKLRMCMMMMKMLPMLPLMRKMMTKMLQTVRRRQS
jgi:hypothetical protein